MWQLSTATLWRDQDVALFFFFIWLECRLKQPQMSDVDNLTLAIAPLMGLRQTGSEHSSTPLQHRGEFLETAWLLTHLSSIHPLVLTIRVGGLPAAVTSMWCNAIKGKFCLLYSLLWNGLGSPTCFFIDPFLTQPHEIIRTLLVNGNQSGCDTWMSNWMWFMVIKQCRYHYSKYIL